MLPRPVQRAYSRHPVVLGAAVLLCHLYVALSMLVFGHPLSRLAEVGRAVLTRWEGGMG